jgi:hypothetical protein
MSSHEQIERLEQRYFLNGQAPGWSDTITNPYFPLLVGSEWVYSGTKDGETELDRVQVTNTTKVVTGVTTTVVLDRVYINGELAEKTYDHYAQDKAGNVWYFGEDSRDIENGKVVSREGSWEAGVNGAKAGIIMQAKPGVGDRYFQEMAIGVAEDQAQNVSLAGGAVTPFGSFQNCLRTSETSPLDVGSIEQKFYAPGIGEVKETSAGDEVEVLKLKSFTVGPAGFSDTIDNPFFPVLPGSVAVFKGSKDGESETERVIVTNDTKVITGVTTTVVFDRVFVNGELAEKTYDHFAQDKIGNVWYFGEDSREIENGQVTSREGSWEAGVNGAKAGIVMQVIPGVGNNLHQEDAPGVAEDQATTLAVGGAHADVPFATFNNCLLTQEFTVLEPGALEQKFYAAGIGLVKSQAISGEQEILRLVEYTA